MNITITINRRASDKELMKAQLALLSLFSVCDDIFTEHDTLSKAKRRMSLGRVYEEWKRCRVVLDPGFNPHKHDMMLRFGAKPKIVGGGDR